MRHGKKINHLGRKSAHRKAMLSNMACSLIEHKRIKTTLAKAKALRKYVEPLITKSKDDTTHSRRVVFSYLKNKEAVKELFGDISEKVASRPGGYTRILKIGPRPGDNAEMALIELVDFNELAPGKLGAAGGKKKSRRRRGKKAGGKDTAQAIPAASKVEETTEVEEVEAVEEVTEVVEAETQEVAADVETEDVKPDDLKKIEGIGPKIAEILTGAGFTTFASLAEADVDKIKEILAEAGSRYKSHDPTTWPKQAAMASEGKWDELKQWQDELKGGKEA